MISRRFADGVPALAGLAAATLAGGLAAALGWGMLAPATQLLREVGFTVSWLLVGLLAYRFGRARLARLALLLGFVLAANLPTSLGLLDTGAAASLVATAGTLIRPLQTPLGAHVLLAFPTGRLPGRSARPLMGIAYALAAVEAALPLLSGEPRLLPVCDGCAAAVLPPPVLAETTASAVVQVLAAAWLPLAVWAVALVTGRYRWASARQRRVLVLPYAAIVVNLVVFLWVAAAAAWDGEPLYGQQWSTVAVQLAATAGVPLCLAAGLLRERLSHARVSELVRRLGVAGTDITAALASTLEDPHLVVAFPRDGAWVDARGGRIDLARYAHTHALTLVGDPGQPLAALLHDPSLRDEPALLAAVTSAAHMLVANAALHNQVRTQLDEVRRSRARLVAATDLARRRIERDLHDGAQQRILAAGLALRLLADRLRPTGLDGELLTRATDEIQGALRELRELAAGIHPAVLTEQGLAAAVQDLAARAAIDVQVTGSLPAGLPEPAQTAAYFAVSEAVANAAKHSGAASVEVRLAASGPAGDEPRKLVVRVCDRGRGGADPTGDGLRGIADRVAAANGTLRIDSPTGSGTTIHLELPCES